MRGGRGLALGVAIVLVAFPWIFQQPYPRDVMIRIFLYALLAQAWNLLGGYCGQVSLGSAVFALLAYVTVALGGFGNVAATLLGGALIGLVENLVGLWAPAFKYVGVFCFYLLVVLWRPQGLFGRY